MLSNSPRFDINWTDIYKVTRGSLVVAIATFIVQFATQVQNMVTSGQIDLGELSVATPLVIAASSWLVELGRRYVKDYSKG